MSALAQALLDSGASVSGADRTLGTPVLARLSAQGVRILPNDGSGVADETTRLVVSTAIEDDNPDLVAAKARGIPVVHRAAALAEALSPHRLVAVAGTCGKSTVTAMLGHVLAECGFDPLVVNGAQVVGWDGNGKRVGSVREAAAPRFAVAEVDESDKSLSAFHPYAAIVTNASADHYSKEEMDEVFDAFVKDVPGPVVDGRVRRDFPFSAAGRVPMPGAHNVRNAELAVAMAVELGAPLDAALKAIETFPGVERRMQRVGECAGAIVYDDYAHNPEKLHATITTLQEAYPRGIAVLWRPHGYGPLRKMKDALAAMFAATLRPEDALYLLPVYDAGGTADRSVNSEALGIGEVLPDLAAAERALREAAPRFGAIAICGARDPGLPVLARGLCDSPAPNP